MIELGTPNSGRIKYSASICVSTFENVNIEGYRKKLPTTSQRHNAAGTKGTHYVYDVYFAFT